MGREVRRVSADWEHPIGDNGKYKPLHGGELPRWKISEATHYQMYENTTEGTPISPPTASTERLAHWLVEHEANAGVKQTASYEAWLRVCKGQPAFSFAMANGKCINGVEAAYQGDLSRRKEERLLELIRQRESTPSHEQGLRPVQEWKP